MILVICVSKLTLSIFFVGAFVLAQFWAIASIISCSVKKLIFLMKNVKMGDFVSVISAWKRRLQKKQSIPQRSQRKMQENCHLRFLIFKLLSQRFFDLKLAIFRFFKNSKKRKFWRFWPPNCGRFLNTQIKVNRCKMLVSLCTSKLLLSIFFVAR